MFKDTSAAVLVNMTSANTKLAKSKLVAAAATLAHHIILRFAIRLYFDISKLYRGQAVAYCLIEDGTCAKGQKQTSVNPDCFKWNSVSGNVLSSLALRHRVRAHRVGCQSAVSGGKGSAGGPLELTLFFPVLSGLRMQRQLLREAVACERTKSFHSNGLLAVHFVTFAEHKCGWHA